MVRKTYFILTELDYPSSFHLGIPTDSASISHLSLLITIIKGYVVSGSEAPERLIVHN